MGIVLLAIGLLASFYPQVKTYTTGGYWGVYGEWVEEQTHEASRTYPYQGIGIMLSLAGIVMATLGLLISTRQK